MYKRHTRKSRFTLFNFLTYREHKSLPKAEQTIVPPLHVNNINSNTCELMLDLLVDYVWKEGLSSLLIVHVYSTEAVITFKTSTLDTVNDRDVK